VCGNCVDYKYFVEKKNRQSFAENQIIQERWSRGGGGDSNATGIMGVGMQ